MKPPSILGLILFGTTLVTTLHASELISRTAYAANAGWINGHPPFPEQSNETAVQVSHYHLSGKAYAANFGWIDLGDGSPDSGVHYHNKSGDFGVNFDLATGKLRGFAYSGNIGWINFEKYGDPRIDLITGCFLGHAWSPNCGWIALNPTDGTGWKIEHFGTGPDTDKDGIPDPWELNQTGKLTVLSGETDTDGDGQSDCAEYTAGTDPTDPNSVFGLTLIPTTGGFDLSWPSQPGRFFTLFSSEDLKEWKVVPEVENMPGDPDTMMIEVTPAEDQNRLFWRVRPSLPLTP